MTRKQGFKKIEDEPNFQLVIANSNIEHSTESMVSEVKAFVIKNKEEFSKLLKSRIKIS